MDTSLFRNSIRLLLLALAPLAWTNQAVAGAWNLPEGEGQVIPSAWVESGFRRNDQGDGQGHFRFSKIDWGTFVEYGYNPNWTIGGRASLVSYSRNDRTDRPFALGDSDLFARRQLWRSERSVLSVQGNVTVPGSYDPNSSLALADGKYHGELRVGFGTSFTDSIFVDLASGYRFRIGSPLHQARADVTLGYKAANGSMALIQSFNTIGVGIRPDEQFSYDLAQFLGQYVFKLNPALSISAGAGGTPFGSDHYRSTIGFTSLWIRFP